jgi:hypothetical protein
LVVGLTTTKVTATRLLAAANQVGFSEWEAVGLGLINFSAIGQKEEKAEGEEEGLEGHEETPWVEVWPCLPHGVLATPNSLLFGQILRTISDGVFRLAYALVLFIRLTGQPLWLIVSPMSSCSGRRGILGAWFVL